VRGWRGSSGNVGWLLPVISDEKSTVGSLDSDSSSQFSLLKLEFGGSESTWHPSSSMPHSDSSDPVSEIDSLNRTPPPVDSNLNDPNTALREPSEAFSGIADLFLTPPEVAVRRTIHGQLPRANPNKMTLRRDRPPKSNLPKPNGRDGAWRDT
jgi:hypothetical protein